MARGSAISLDYQIPSQFIQPQQTQPPPQVEPSITTPDIKQHLANVKGLTDKYFDLDSKLDAYATSMARDYGIDVTKPDPTQPKGGTPFRTYQELAASLMYIANDLGNSQKMNEMLAQQQAEGNILFQPGFDPTQQASSTLRPDQMFTSTKLDPQVSQANDFLQREVYTQRDADKLNSAVRDPLVNFYSQQITKDPANRAYYERQLAAIGKAAPKTPYTTFQSPTGGAKTPGIAVLREVTNLSNGVWGPGTYKTITKGGKVYAANEAKRGESYGQYIDYDEQGRPIYRPKIIKRWLKDPQSGTVTLEFEDSEIPTEVVSGQPGSIVTTNFIANNAKYGDASKMMDAAMQLGILDESGASIDQYLMPQNYQQIQGDVRKSIGSKASKIGNIVNQTTSILNNIKDPLLGNNWNEFTLPNGSKVQIGKHRGKNEFFIKNWQDLGYTSEPSALSPKQAIEQLSNLGYFEKYLEDPTNSPADKPKTVTQNGYTYTLNPETGEYE